MATVSGGQASVMAGGTASFGQFRLTTFVDSGPNPSRKTSTLQRTTSSDGTAEPASLQMENGRAISASQVLQPYQNSLQASQAFTQKSPASSAPTVPSTEAVSTSHNGFGVINLAPPPRPVRKGKLGPHRDGRVRNPVPLKLKGKTDERNGNFAVMHMDMSGSGSLNSLPRSEAAQRTSENTANAAKSANKAGYIPMKRRRIEPPSVPKPANDSPVVQATPPLPPPPPPPPAPALVPMPVPIPVPVPASAPAPTFVSFSPNQQGIVHRDRALTSDEAKYEQARLLTLLRSINPLTVVDQICKALAFFGGIPGAPPPEDGTFPDSADSNGSGGLFVGWLSEIFPELERKSWKAEVPRPREIARPSRPRGRPKGSKGSKVRKDKGIKKGPKNSVREDPQNLDTPLLSQTRPTRGTTVDGDNQDEEWVDVTEVELILDKDGSQPQRPLGIEQNLRGNHSDMRRQGSSSNRISSVNLDMLNVGHDDLAGGQVYRSSGQDYSSQPLNSNKRRPGRPKGSRNRSKNPEVEDDPAFAFLSPDQPLLSQIGDSSSGPGSHQRPVQTSGTGILNRAKVVHPGDQSRSFGTAQKPVIVGSQSSPLPSNKRRQSQAAYPRVMSREEQVVIDAFRSAGVLQVGQRPRPSSGIRVVNKQPSVVPATLSSNAREVSSSATGKVNSQPNSISQAARKDVAPAPILPPPKRQRKPKESNPVAAKKGAQVVEPSKTGPTPSIILKSTTSSSDAGIPAMMATVRASVQGLEGHYEGFTLQHQEDQQQAQHHLNPVTRSSPMQPTTTYYRHLPTSYDAQYASHPPSNPYQPALLPQTESFRNSTPRAFPSRQQQQQQQQSNHHFNPFPGSSFIDVPALEAVSGGTRNVGSYGQTLARSGSNGTFGSGAQLTNGFENMGDSDIRERLLRGMGRR